MTRYKKKPVEIEAVQFTDTSESLAAISELVPDKLMLVNYRARPLTMTVPTKEGTMIATEGDYIIKGVEGEVYACKPGIFHKTYEQVGE